MMTSRSLFRLLLAALLAVSVCTAVTGCGNKGPLVRPTPTGH